MTNQEAVKWIDGQVLELSLLVDITRTDKEKQRINEEYNALLLARAALKKRIPVKPEIKETEKPFARVTKSGVLKRTVCSCPLCGNPLYVQHHFEYTSEYGNGFDRWPAGSQTPCCPKCGQALKWGAENDR